MKHKDLLLYFVTVYAYISCDKEKPDQNSPAEGISDNRAYLLKPGSFPSQSFTINAGEDALVKGKGGTQLFIPKNMFEDLSGNPVSGEIKIELKEVLTRADMVLSNLFTTHKNEALESGGMVYIDVKQGDMKLRIREDKAIEIAVPGERKTGMQIFEGVENADNLIDWINPKDIVPPAVTDTNADGNKSVSKNKAHGIPKPVKPERYSPDDDDLISVDFADPSLFPEFDIYKDVQFKLLEPASYKPEDTQREWSSVRLNKTEKDGVYTIIFTDGTRVKSYLVKPVFNGTDYTKALADYNDKIAKYEAAQKDFEQNQWKAWSRKRNTSNTFNPDPGTNYIFQAKGLGWHNIDRLYEDPNAIDVEFYASVGNRAEFSSVNVALVFNGQNIFLPAYENQDKAGQYRFIFDPAKPMKLPLGAKVSVLATSYKDDAPYFAIRNITVSNAQDVKLVLEKTTIEDLKKELADKV
jgi:hypothetical protein